jgi:hypothetical protein
MRLRARLTRLEGRLVSASFTVTAVIANERDGSARLVVGGIPIPPGDARESHYEILEMSSDEFAQLRRCGYSFSLQR